MHNVTVNKYRTPTRDNRDCEWSVGVMNLTEREAGRIADFARAIRSVNSDRARGLTATELREQRGLSTTFESPYEQTRADALRGAWDERTEAIKEAAKEPEPEEPRNRFSGLDIE